MFETFPHERTTIFHGYPDADHRGRFAGGDVRVERADDGRVVAESANHRRTFAGLRKYRRWSALDALYFFGYAVWHYHTLPFTLREAEVVRALPARGSTTGVDVVFPADVHTHCRRQQFYFDATGRIVRHDYVAEIIGSWARGAHFWEDYGAVNGLLVARRRRIVARAGRLATTIPVLCIQFGEPS